MRTSGLGRSGASLGSLILGSTTEGGLTNSFNDTVTFTDEIRGVLLEFTDPLVFSETLTTDNELFLTIPDSVSFTDGIRQTWEVGLSDTVTFSDTCETVIWKDGDFSDTVSLLEQLLTELTVERTLSEAIEFQDTLQRTLVRLLAFSDTVSFSDTLNGVGTKVLGDTATFSDVITAFVAKVFRDTLEFNEALSPDMEYHRGIFDQLVLYDSISLTHVTRITLSDTLTLSDGMVGDGVHPLSPDTVTLSDTISGERSTPVGDTLTLSDTSSTLKTVNKALGDPLFLTDTWTPNLVVERFIGDTIEFLDLMRGVRAKPATMSDSLTLVDGVLREVHVVNWSDTLTLIDAMTFSKDSTRTSTDVITLTDSLSPDMEYNLLWNDLLAFADGYQVKVRTSNTVNEGINLVTPVLPTIPTGATGYIPSPIWEGVTRIRSQVVFIGQSMSVVMPPPEFNDFDANESKIAVQRSMTGRFRVFAKKAEREKRNWRFVVPRHKADEFKAFLLAEVNNNLTVIDWEANYWSAKIKSDSVDFTESRRWAPCGNATDVTIEIVGNRYA